MLKPPSGPTKQQATVEIGIETVRNLMANPDGDGVLARMYIEIAEKYVRANTGDEKVTKFWSDAIEMCTLLDGEKDRDKLIADEFRFWVNKTFDSLKDPRMMKDFLYMITNGIIEVGKRS